MKIKQLSMTAALLAAGCASSIESKVESRQLPMPTQDESSIVTAEPAPSALESAIAAAPKQEGAKQTFGYNAFKIGKDAEGAAETRSFLEAGLDFPIDGTPYTLMVKSISFTSGAGYSDAIKGIGDTSKTMVRFGPTDWDTKALVNIYGSPDKTTAEFGVWDTHLQKAIGLYGRTEIVAKPDGKSAHALFFVGKEFDFGAEMGIPFGKTLLEFTDGLAWSRETGTGTFQELEAMQYVGKTPFFAYAKLGTTDHHFKDRDLTFGLGFDVGKLFGK